MRNSGLFLYYGSFFSSQDEKKKVGGHKPTIIGDQDKRNEFDSYPGDHFSHS